MFSHGDGPFSKLYLLLMLCVRAIYIHLNLFIWSTWCRWWVHFLETISDSDWIKRYEPCVRPRRNSLYIRLLNFGSCLGIFNDKTSANKFKFDLRSSRMSLMKIRKDQGLNIVKHQLTEEQNKTSSLWEQQVVSDWIDSRLISQKNPDMPAYLSLVRMPLCQTLSNALLMSKI